MSKSPSIEFTDDSGGRSGISITYIKSRKVLAFFGWYDSFVGIQGGSLALKDFFAQLGITKKDALKAFEGAACPNA